MQKLTDKQIADGIKIRLNRPITMVGMMGSGKSTLGAAIARILGYEFYDSDQVIESETGKTVPEIFSSEGDAAFRKHEQNTLRKLLNHPQTVIATGGGCITLPETAEMVFSKSLCVWIDAPVEMLVSRTSRKSNRPLLKNGDPAEILAGLMEKRGPIYSRAPVRVETDEGPVNKVAKRALRHIYDYLLEQGS